MSNREIALQLIEQIPEYKLDYIVCILKDAVYSSEVPNKETLEAFAETEEMIKNGTGQNFKGSTKEFFDMILED